MNLKEQIPAQNLEFNISDKFLRPDRVSYIIDYPSIITCEKTITKGITYVLMISSDSDITMNLVQITDAYWDGYVLSLIFKDLEAKGAGINVEFDIFKEPTKCKWMLIDLKYLQEKIKQNVIDDYCDCK
jgi:hypothetical protein